MEKKNFQEITAIVLKAVATAMGIAVVVLSKLGAMDAQTAVSMLGLGLACAGVAMLTQK